MKLQVSNHTYDLNYKLINATNYDNTPINNIIELYDSLEKHLLELIDNIFKLALSELYAYKYVNVGGKAINTYINKKWLPSSFDFDLHIYGNTDIDAFGFSLANELNKITNTKFPLYRTYIINILTRMNIISKNEYNHYKNNQLFYYGDRAKSGFKISGIFLHFIMRDNIFTNNMKYNNLQNTNTNELYYPVADIDIEKYLNFGLEIIDDTYTFSLYDNIRYSNYLVTLHNLIKYTTLQGFKTNKNFSKLSHFSDISHYSCSFLNSTLNFNNAVNLMNITTTIDNIPLVNVNGTNIEVSTIMNGKEVFQIGRKLSDIMKDYINYYQNNRISALNNCNMNIILNSTSNNKNIIFKSHVSTNIETQQNILTELEKILYNTDTNRYILYYSGIGYSTINTLCTYKYLRIPLSNLNSPLNNIQFQKHIIFSDDTNDSVNINIPINDYSQIENIADSITSLIQNIRNNTNYETLLDDFEDEFYVYRCQNFICINSPKGDQFNPSIIDKNMIIYIPFFMSTSFSTSYTYENFINTNTFLLKIKIDKKLKNWILLNKYSAYPRENEILIDKDQFLVVEETYTAGIIINNNIKDINVVQVKLCDSLYSAKHKAAEMALSHNTNNIRLVNIHDDMVRESRITKIVMDRYSNISKLVIINYNMLLFNTTERNPCDSLLDNIFLYNDIVTLIIDSNSISKQTIEKMNSISTINIEYNIFEKKKYPMDKIPEMPSPKQRQMRKYILRGIY